MTAISGAAVLIVVSIAVHGSYVLWCTGLHKDANLVFYVNGSYLNWMYTCCFSKSKSTLNTSMRSVPTA